MRECDASATTCYACTERLARRENKAVVLHLLHMFHTFFPGMWFWSWPQPATSDRKCRNLKPHPVRLITPDPHLLARDVVLFFKQVTLLPVENLSFLVCVTSVLATLFGHALVSKECNGRKSITLTAISTMSVDQRL